MTGLGGGGWGGRRGLQLLMTRGGDRKTGWGDRGVEGRKRRPLIENFRS